MGQSRSGRQRLPLFTATIAPLVHLERDSSVPLYQQISHGLREAILSGELVEGTRLPTERALAQELAVNRTTVMNAYNELTTEGLIEGHVGRGTLVRKNLLTYNQQQSDQDIPPWLLSLPATESEVLGPDARVLSELAALNEQEDIISLAVGTPALDLLPGTLLAPLINEGLLQAGQQTLGYSPIEGAQHIRQSIAARMRRRGVDVEANNILILSGSTQGIGLVGRFLLSPGDEVVVEIPTYLGAIQTFRALGARVLGVPVDNEGMRVDLLESILARRRPRLIYTQPTFQNPTGAVLSLERRRRLILLAQRYQTPILEDDPYGELYFEGRAPQPLKALDKGSNLLYLSTYSKILAPGLGVAWLAAPSPMIERISLHKQIFDVNTSSIGQWAVAEMHRRNLLDTHMEHIRREYRQKRDLMLHAIEQYWGPEIGTNRPGGGFHVWGRLPQDIRARVLLREAANEHVTFVVGELFHIDGGGQHQFRLSFAYPKVQEIEQGIERIGRAMNRLLSRRKTSTEIDQIQGQHLPVV